MKRYYKLFSVKALFFGFSALLLASCSSYQYAGYDNDGIYTSDQTEAYTANEYEESYENALYYQQLFAEKADQFAAVPEEGAIFTDIEGYSSGYDEDYMQEELDYQVGQAAWGTDPDEIAINIYNDPFYRPYYYPYYAGFYDPFWGPYPYYRYSHYGYPYGYYSGWSIGIGFGWSSWRYGYSPYYSPYWGGYYPYYRPHYYPYHYNYRDVAYTSTRRNSYGDYRDYNRTNIDARSTRIQRYSNPRDVRAVRSNSDRRTYQTRSTRVRSNDTPYRTNRSRSTEYRTRRSSDNSVRAVRSNRTRSNNTTTRVRSTRSSGNNSAVRSSSSSTRSSSTRSSSGSSRSNRGRGN